MLRFAPKLFILASMVLFLLTAALWYRSYSVLDRLYYSNTRGEESITSNWGSIEACADWDDWPDAVPFKDWIRFRARPYGKVQQLQRPADQGILWDLHFIGFSSSATIGGTFSGNGWPKDSTQHASYPPGFDVRVPHAIAALLFAILPFRAARRAISTKRRSQNACASCGYDLRATPYRCPKCGTLPAETT